MFTCTMPHTFLYDTHVQWWVNGKLLKVEFLAQGQLHLYESLEDLTDLLGDFPTMVRCEQIC